MSGWTKPMPPRVGWSIGLKSASLEIHRDDDLKIASYPMNTPAGGLKPLKNHIQA
jgi:hypothetical protein